MNEVTDYEVWISPNGRALELRPIAFEAYVPADDEEDQGGWEWYADEPGQRPPQRYGLFATTGALRGKMVEDYTVAPCGGWSAYDAISDVLIRDGFTPPAPTEEELAVCVHGMSAMLCEGPNHYGYDR